VVRRAEKAYPVYGEQYAEAVDVIRRFIERVPNLQLAGRNGMHHYNNQDHSMLTGMLAARNTQGASYDLWKVNVADTYGEEGLSLSEEALSQFERKPAPQA
jgi:hypothetical protein